MDIDMFNIGVFFYELVDFPMRAFVVEPNVETEGEGDSDACEAVGTITGMLVNHLIEKNVPHNLLISNFGKTVYIFLRQFQPEEEISFSFLEASGLVRVPKQDQFDGMQAEELRVIIDSKIACKVEVYEEIKAYFINQLRSIYI
jgi:hypothetical protein